MTDKIHSDVPAGDGNISIWDAGVLLEEAGKSLKTANTIWARVADQAQEDAESTVGFAKTIIASVRDVYADLTKETDGAAELAWSAIKRLRDADRALRELRAERQPVYVGDLKELVEFAERCNHMTDEQWARVMDLAKALRRPVNAE